MKTSKSFNQEYIEKAKTLIHEILEDKKEYDDWTQICFSIQNAVQAAANIWGISSDEQINKMRAFITEMVLTELSNLKQFDIKLVALAMLRISRMVVLLEALVGT